MVLHLGCCVYSRRYHLLLEVFGRSERVPLRMQRRVVYIHCLLVYSRQYYFLLEVFSIFSFHSLKSLYLLTIWVLATMVVMVVLDLLKQSHPLAATEMILQKHKKYNQHVATWNQKKHIIIPNGKNTTTTKIFIIYITVQYIFVRYCCALSVSSSLCYFFLLLFYYYY